MAETLLVAGTASHVGKSTVAAGLCRYLADRGVSVAPFKAQNMSNNARATPGGEIGVSQYVQARAAGVAPSTDHNPVLLKPRGDGESQLVLDGEAVGHFEARGYYDDHWTDALETARAAHDRLVRDHDVVVAEGAGSIAEINLHDRDLANVETARFADADVLLVADIERGGVFASLVGTLELLPDDVRERVVGAVVTKFRGDRSLLDPGIEEFEARTGVPVLGVLPYDDPGLPEEDSVSLPAVGERAVVGADDGMPDSESVTVAVPRLPRISNFTDLEPLAREPGVRVAYVPPEATLDDADAVVLPGSKNTVDDLLALTDAGFGDRLRAFEGPVVGLCGGYQMLGEEITNAAVEGTGDADRVEGLGLLPVATAFSASKTVEHVERDLRGVGPLAGASGTVEGYEIHMGDSTLTGDAARPFDGDGAATDGVLGTYLHDLFVNDTARVTFVRNTFDSAGIDPPPAAERDEDDPYDRAAALVADHLDLDLLGLP
ncbi:cobyric acid synthase [Haloarcula brevis]|uniref:cobyric acid synthase n=1 Tax=Haloarcula brevis TaxID=3111453 RepID=UPI00300EB824